MNSLPSLMNRLSIKSVYWVDDENATPHEMSAEKLILTVAEELERNDTDKRKNALGKLRTIPDARGLADDIHNKLIATDVDDIVGTIALLFSNKLDKVVKEPIKVLIEMLSTFPQPLAPQERKGLIEAFTKQNDWTWKEMSFTSWNTEHIAILDHHTNGGGNALLIVDLQNSRESSPLSGQDVLAHWADRISKSNGSVPIYAVALTSKFKKEHEIIEGRRFTKALFQGMQIPALPVLVISKDRLSSSALETTPESLVTKAFETTLSRLRASKLHSSLAIELQAIFSESVDSAFSKLQQLSIEELLYAVSSSSFHEGASEIDTLIRLASIAQREALLVGVVASNKITTELIELRGLHDHIGFIEAHELDSTDGIKKLRCSELHDPAEVVNRLLAPITAGDIFEISDETSKRYQILVSNACDLMLRGTSGKRKLDVGLLLSLGDFPGSKSGPDSMVFPIADFPQNSPLANRKCAVNLRSMLTVPLGVLDLSWTNVNGNCSWAQGQALPSELSFLPSQRLRYEEISKDLEAIKSKEQLHLFAPWIPFECQFADEAAKLLSVKFAVRRVGRLSARVGAELIQKFAQSLARTTQEHDFLPSN
jgi:hypothetical protein